MASKPSQRKEFHPWRGTFGQFMAEHQESVRGLIRAYQATGNPTILDRIKWQLYRQELLNRVIKGCKRWASHVGKPFDEATFLGSADRALREVSEEWVRKWVNQIQQGANPEFRIKGYLNTVQRRAWGYGYPKPPKPPKSPGGKKSPKPPKSPRVKMPDDPLDLPRLCQEFERRLSHQPAQLKLFQAMKAISPENPWLALEDRTLRQQLQARFQVKNGTFYSWISRLRDEWNEFFQGLEDPSI